MKWPICYRTLAYFRKGEDYPDPRQIVRTPVVIFTGVDGMAYYLEYYEEAET